MSEASAMIGLISNIHRGGSDTLHARRPYRWIAVGYGFRMGLVEDRGKLGTRDVTSTNDLPVWILSVRSLR